MLHPKYLSSAANAGFRRWKRICEAPRSVKKFGTTLAEGLHLAEVIIERGAAVRSVILSEAAAGEAERLAGAAAGGGADCYVLKASLYDSLELVKHGAGIALEIEVPQPELPGRPLAVDGLYLDGVQDAGNAGTLIRTAVAAGVGVIAASVPTACLWAPRVLRAGMGAHFAARIYEWVEPAEMRRVFAGRVLAADARGGRDLFAAEGWEKGPVVWIAGAEGPGLSEEALAAADERYCIPIEPDCESLNVGAAAAVCLFEQRRRRLACRAAAPAR